MPSIPGGRITAEQYLRFVDEGVLGPDDRVELLEGDLAVVPGSFDDYDDAHPCMALLIVEVGDTSLVQDRLTKAAIYAGAAVPEYWIIDVRGQRVEVYRDPVADQRRHRIRTFAGRDERLQVAALPGVAIAVDELLPAVAR